MTILPQVHKAADQSKSKESGNDQCHGGIDEVRPVLPAPDLKDLKRDLRAKTLKDLQYLRRRDNP
jgi:hypothetical protein